MSLYNAMMGYNSAAPICLRILKTHPSKIARFRNAWVTDDGKHIVILTRTGGGNREEYADHNDILKKLSGYVRDFDDLFDPTFAHFQYEVPEELVADAIEMADAMNKLGIGEESNAPAACIEKMISDGEDKPPHDMKQVVRAVKAHARLVNKVVDEDEVSGPFGDPDNA